MLTATTEVLTSKATRRVFLNATLLVGYQAVLFFAAALASWLFFKGYLPDQTVDLPLHLQYGSGPNPYAITALGESWLKSRQGYDVAVTLLMPRSPVNVDRGNFMVSLFFMSPGRAPKECDTPFSSPEPYDHFEGKNVLFSSRRPALLPYQDPISSRASQVIFILYHLLFPDAQICTLTIPMAEDVRFLGTSKLPASVYVEIQAGQTIQISQASIILTARLRGLRYFMHRHGLLSFFGLCTLFWACEFAFLCLAWLFWTTKRAPSTVAVTGSDQKSKDARVQTEQSADVPIAFPSYGRQPPLRYEPPIKDEENEFTLEDIAPPGTEADDEDDASQETSRAWKGDSGIGTSYSEGSDVSLLRRRLSQHR